MDISLTEYHWGEDNVSPYVFVICAEILGIPNRENKNIEGMILMEKEHEISQYADDTTLLLKYDRNVLDRAL